MTLALLCRIYAALLYAYPREFRARFGREMRQDFRDRCRAALASANTLRFLGGIAKDWLHSSVTERIASMRWKRTLAMAGLTVLVCLFVSTTFLQAFYVPSASMENSLLPGDYILVKKRMHGADVRRGDLVTFRYHEDPSETFIKRVIGLPGDRIRLRDKQVIRNGEPLVEPYVIHSMSNVDTFRDNFPDDAGNGLTPHGRDMLAHHIANGEVTVPPGTMFVLGDNRDESLDSRYWGFVPLENVVGKPFLVYWSYDAPATKTRWDRTLKPLH
jgi:signal peptidase I